MSFEKICCRENLHILFSDNSPTDEQGLKNLNYILKKIANDNAPTKTSYIIIVAILKFSSNNKNYSGQADIFVGSILFRNKRRKKLKHLIGLFHLMDGVEHIFGFWSWLADLLYTFIISKFRYDQYLFILSNIKKYNKLQFSWLLSILKYARCYFSLIQVPSRILIINLCICLYELCYDNATIL